MCSRWSSAGHSLVADDITRIRSLEGRELIGTSSDLSRFHMEVRGLGIINIASIYGVRSIRFEKRLDMVVTLQDWHEVPEIDRIGLEQDYYEILQIRIPHVTIPGPAREKPGESGRSGRSGPEAEGHGPEFCG